MKMVTYTVTAVIFLILAVSLLIFIRRFTLAERRRMHIDEPLRQVLRHASTVDIEYNTNKQEWRGFYDGTLIATTGPQWKDIGVKNSWLSGEQNATMLALLKGSRGFHQLPPPPQSQGFVFFFRIGQERSSPPHPFVYISQTGELGRGHDWCYVPLRFKAWMKSQVVNYSAPTPQETPATGTTVFTLSGHTSNK